MHVTLAPPAHLSNGVPRQHHAHTAMTLTASDLDRSVLCDETEMMCMPMSPLDPFTYAYTFVIHQPTCVSVEQATRHHVGGCGPNALALQPRSINRWPDSVSNHNPRVRAELRCKQIPNTGALLGVRIEARHVLLGRIVPLHASFLLTTPEFGFADGSISVQSDGRARETGVWCSRLA